MSAGKVNIRHGAVKRVSPWARFVIVILLVIVIV